jgi:Co/Zn/Cd efflux system component
VHDLHLWSLTADLPAASVHLAVNPETDKEQVVTCPVRDESDLFCLSFGFTSIQIS